MNLNNSDVAISVNTNYGSHSIFLKRRTQLKPAPIVKIPPPGIPRTIKSSNATPWGAPQGMRYCPQGSYAIGLRTAVERKLGDGDDTALNTVQFVCGRLNGSQTKRDVGPPNNHNWGQWTPYKMCPKGSFVASFTLQVEPKQGKGDDTGANNIKFGCRSFASLQRANQNPEPNIEMPKITNWGSYGQNAYCPQRTAACGIDVVFERHRKDQDDTAANNVHMRCCNASQLIR